MLVRSWGEMARGKRGGCSLGRGAAEWLQGHAWMFRSFEPTRRPRAPTTRVRNSGLSFGHRCTRSCRSMCWSDGSGCSLGLSDLPEAPVAIEPIALLPLHFGPCQRRP